MMGELRVSDVGADLARRVPGIPANIWVCVLGCQEGEPNGVCVRGQIRGVEGYASTLFVVGASVAKCTQPASLSQTSKRHTTHPRYAHTSHHALTC